MNTEHKNLRDTLFDLGFEFVSPNVPTYDYLPSDIQKKISDKYPEGIGAWVRKVRVKTDTADYTRVFIVFGDRVAGVCDNADTRWGLFTKANDIWIPEENYAYLPSSTKTRPIGLRVKQQMVKLLEFVGRDVFQKDGRFAEYYLTGLMGLAPDDPFALDSEGYLAGLSARAKLLE